MPRVAARYLKRRIELPTSLFLTLPLFLLYHLGVVLVPATAGADLVTGALLRLVAGDRLAYVGALVAIAAVLLLAVWLSNRRRPLPRELFAPLLLESGLYALTMGTFIVFVMVELLRIDPRLAAGLGGGLAAAVVTSLGAGFHEELVFRQGLLPLLGAAARRAGVGPRLALALAVLASSAIFAAAHHVGPGGEPWRVGALVYRTLAGAFFAGLFLGRGLCVAAWTHALYDVWVTAIR